MARDTPLICTNASTILPLIHFIRYRMNACPSCRSSSVSPLGKLYYYSQRQRFKCAACGTWLCFERPRNAGLSWPAKLVRSNIGLFVVLPALYLVLIGAVVGAAAVSGPFVSSKALLTGLLFLLGVHLVYSLVRGVKHARLAQLVTSEHQRGFVALDAFRAIGSAWKVPEFKVGVFRLLIFSAELLFLLWFVIHAVRWFKHAA